MIASLTVVRQAGESSLKRRITQSGLVDAKNSLRPFFRNSKRLPRWQQFQSIRREIPATSLPDVFKVIELNPAYYFSGLGNVFPKDTDSIPDTSLRRLTPLSLVRELTIHVHRINHHADTLLPALESLSEINRHVAGEDWDSAQSSVRRHLSLFGYSLVLARKEMLIAFNQGGLPALSKAYTSLVGTSERRAWGLFCHIFYDFTDPAFHPSRPAKLWFSVIKNRPPINRWYTYVAQNELVPNYTDSNVIAETILRYNSTSILDLMLYIWSLKSARPDLTSMAQSWSELDGRISASLHSQFEFSTFVIPRRYRVGVSFPTDVEIVRASYFHSEMASVQKWRMELNSFLFPISGSASEVTIDRAADNLSDASLALHDVDQGLERAERIIRKWLVVTLPPGSEPGECRFIMSIIVARALNDYSNGMPIDERHVVSLISATEDLHDYVSTDVLIRISALKGISSLPILDFIVRDILFRQSRTQDNDLERRASFMTLFTGPGRLGIIPFFDSVMTWNASTALHIARVCTRSFLERLYLLMSSVKDVLETRIEVCKWLTRHDSTGADVLREEHDALERELSNLDARSDLDSTRVHVDEESLREWFYETQYLRVSRYAQTVISEAPGSRHDTLLVFYNKLRERDTNEEGNEDFLKETQIGSEFLLLEIAEETIRAFVSDRTFGLDAYLSRRIRHGTLNGFLITPISRVINKIRGVIASGDFQANELNFQSVLNMLENWRAGVSVELDRARKHLIQVRSPEKPDGIIEATWRTASNVTHIDAMIARVRDRVLDSKGDYDLFPDIYSLCWDVLERDLAQIRLYIARDFYKRMMERLNVAHLGLTHDQRQISHIYFVELHRLFESRVQEICGWFIRPVFRRDKYDLRTLVDSIVSIIRELDASYSFEDDIFVDENIDINRGSFEVIGDILFVLIGNAAKHGRRGGTILIEAGRVGDDLVRLEVTSQNDDLPSYQRAQARISEAITINSASLHNAAVDEGFSGIRKVMGLIEKTRSGESELMIIKRDADLSFIFSVTVSTGIIFRRERA